MQQQVNQPKADRLIVFDFDYSFIDCDSDHTVLRKLYPQTFAQTNLKQINKPGPGGLAIDPTAIPIQPQWHLPSPSQDTTKVPQEESASNFSMTDKCWPERMNDMFGMLAALNIDFKADSKQILCEKLDSILDINIQWDKKSVTQLFDKFTCLGGSSATNRANSLIISDANSIFIRRFLKLHNIRVDQVVTNPAWFEPVSSVNPKNGEYWRFRVDRWSRRFEVLNSLQHVSSSPSKALIDGELFFYDKVIDSEVSSSSAYITPPACHETCAPNMCKAWELNRYIQSTQAGKPVANPQREYPNAYYDKFDQIIYVGDGRNDYCAMSSLRGQDFALIRRGRGLEKFLSELERQDGILSPESDSDTLSNGNKSHWGIKAKVIWWNEMAEILQFVESIWADA